MVASNHSCEQNPLSKKRHVRQAFESKSLHRVFKAMDALATKDGAVYTISEILSEFGSVYNHPLSNEDKFNKMSLSLTILGDLLHGAPPSLHSSCF